MQRNSTNSIIKNIKFVRSKGKLLYKKKTRYLLIRPETLIGFQKAMEEKHKKQEVSKFIIKGGVEGGGKAAETLKNQGLNTKNILTKMCKWGTELGWGRLTLKKFKKTEFFIEVVSSPFAKTYGKSKTPVCHLIQGVFQGVGEIIHKKAVSSKEIKCISKGDKTCIFQIKL